MPLIATPLACSSGSPPFDMKYLPFSMASNGEYAAQSLASAHELGHLPDSKRRALFSRVRYYPPPIDLGDERSAPARKDTKNNSTRPSIGECFTGSDGRRSRTAESDKANEGKKEEGEWRSQIPLCRDRRGPCHLKDFMHNEIILEEPMRKMEAMGAYGTSIHPKVRLLVVRRRISPILTVFRRRFHCFDGT